MKLLLWTCLLLGWGRPALAQDQPLPPRVSSQPTTPGYTVVGRVVCADTQHAARFAQVTLLSATSGGGEGDWGRRGGTARTDLDGRFSVGNVTPGDYFVTVDLAGYVDDSVAVRAAVVAGGTALDSVSGVARVQVTAGGGSVQVSLQRGAVLAGNVQWDDGSPAAGVGISAQPAPAANSNGTTTASSFPGLARPVFNRAASGQTDDRGRFRLSGLAPGSYTLRANLQSPVPGATASASRFPRLMTLRVYAPNKQRQTEAAVYTVAAGEERGDIGLTLALSGMHAVSGQVSSSAAEVHGGSVQLTDQADSSLNRRGDINPDGTFTLTYVPPGNYTLQVTASAQGSGVGQPSNPTRFQPLQESVTVADSDLSGLNLVVTPAAPAQ